MAEQHGQAGPRRIPPPVDAGGEDRPLEGNGGAPAIRATQGEPQTFGDRLNLAKLEFGQKLIGWSVSLIVVLSLIGYFFDRDSTMISGTLEMLKLVTTTALGFVFAKTMESERKEDE